MTPPPVNTTCQAFELGTASVGSTIQHRGNWSTACRHFRFFVRQAHVIADLDGEVSLQLRRTTSEWQTLENFGRSDGNPESTGRDTRIGRTVPRGWYVLEARLDDPRAGGVSVDLDLDITAEEAAHLDGAHQSDHAVGYELGDNLDSPMKMEMELVVDMWHDALSGSWPNIEFCEHPCNSTNYDRQPVVMRAAPPGECDKKVACVRHDEPYDSSDPHLHGVVLRLENPATGNLYNRPGEPDAVFIWTSDFRKHLTLVPGTTDLYYWHMRGTMMHEVGHVVGADDQEFSSPFYHDVMGGGWDDRPYFSVPPRDVTIVLQLYRHAGGEEH